MSMCYRLKELKEQKCKGEFTIFFATHCVIMTLGGGGLPAVTLFYNVIMEDENHAVPVLGLPRWNVCGMFKVHYQPS